MLRALQNVYSYNAIGLVYLSSFSILEMISNLFSRSQQLGSGIGRLNINSMKVQNTLPCQGLNHCATALFDN